jgi:hypothetical protein
VPIKLGPADIQKIYLGSQSLPQAYLGDIPLLSTGIPYSAMFDSASTSMLRDSSQATPTDVKRWTCSFWVKRSAVSAINAALAGYVNANAHDGIFFNATGELRLYTVSAGTVYGNVYTDAVFKDTSEWYHCVVAFDTTQAVASDRVKMWVNGVAQALTFSTEYPLNGASFINNASAILSLGFAFFGANYYSDLLMAELHFVDGQVLTADDFGRTDPATGQWSPIKYKGTYGANGRYCNFSDNGASGANLGLDYSGNALHFTDVVTGFSADHQYADTPTNNACTFLAHTFTNGSISRGGVQRTNNGLTTYPVFGSMDLRPSGKWYYEVKTQGNTDATNMIMVGLCKQALIDKFKTYQIGTSNNLDWVGLMAWTSIALINDGVNTTISGSVTTAQTVQVAYNSANGNVWIGIDDSWYDSVGGNTGDPATDANPTFNIADWGEVFPMVAARGATPNPIATFAHTDFAFTPPAGFLSLSSRNMPNPDVPSPKDNHKAVLYTGNGTAQPIAGVGFQPDLVWIKNRVGALHHIVFDALRGANLSLFPSTAIAEFDQSPDGVVSFDADGFSLNGSQTNWNANGVNFIAWCWKKGATPGFDIVEYTGTGVARTVPHSLGVPPEFMLVKNRIDASSWLVYHKAIGATQYLVWDTNVAAATSHIAWGNTTPDESNFTVSTSNNVNGAGDDLVAYLFAGVEGFSKFGSYEGNGNADGSFINCGFKPAFLMLKNADGAYNWAIYDNTRSPVNARDTYLLNTASAEVTTDTIAIDFTANGFKVRTVGNIQNRNANTILYMAFAESPFKNARAA